MVQQISCIVLKLFWLRLADHCMVALSPNSTYSILTFTPKLVRVSYFF